MKTHMSLPFLPLVIYFLYRFGPRPSQGSLQGVLVIQAFHRNLSTGVKFFANVGEMSVLVLYG
jgi:hypothetical protein